MGKRFFVCAEPICAVCVFVKITLFFILQFSARKFIGETKIYRGNFGWLWFRLPHVYDKQYFEMYSLRFPIDTSIR